MSAARPKFPFVKESDVKTAAELASLVNGVVEGDGTVVACRATSIEEAETGDVAYYASPKVLKAFKATRAGVVLVPLETPRKPNAAGPTYIRVANPQLAFGIVARAFHPPLRAPPSGIAASASVDPSAQIDSTATVMAHGTVCAGATIGPGARLHPGVFVGEGAQIGADTQLGPNVVVMHLCRIGDRCTVHAGAVIGSDGFGFAYDNEAQAHLKVPQLGIARIEDDVEIGACSCIDRATIGETVIGRGSKLDNLVHIAHNVVVGPMSILCAQVGVAGSSSIGREVILAGQVGVADHLRIGDGARVAAQTGVIGDIEPGAQMMGTPALPIREFFRAWANIRRLPALLIAFRKPQDRGDSTLAGPAARGPEKERL